MRLKYLRYIIFLIPLLGLTPPDEPCQKTYHSGDWRNITTVIFYPNCNDTTVFLARTYQNNKLWREEWFKNNFPEGISKYYNTSDSNNCVSSESLWSNGDVLQSTSYFPNSTTISGTSKKISDSLSFNISYYRNGNVKEYGNTKNYMNCECGVWTEYDSLGTYKWVGEYKVIHKEEKDTITDKETGFSSIVTMFTCSTKNGIWKKLDKNDSLLEQIIYVDGVIKPKH